MGSRGPAPKPSSERSAIGRNTLRRKVRAPKPTPVAMPASVKADKVAAGYWKAHAPALITARRLRPDLAEAFGLCCLLKSEMDAMAVELATQERTTTTEKGAYANPLVKILRDTRRDWLALARDFGMTAASDARIPQDAPDVEESKEDAALRLLTVPKRS